MENNEYFDVRGKLLTILDKSLHELDIEKTNPISANRIITLLSNLSSDFIFYYRTIERAKMMIDRLEYYLKMSKETPEKGLYRRDFLTAVNDLYRTFQDENSPRIVKYNTEGFYTKQIQELKEREEKLNVEIKHLKQNKKEQEEKEKELELVKELKRQSEEEKEELLKKLDAQNNLKDRISNAFVELKKHTSFLKEEKTRLNWMFYAYAILCGVVFLVLVIFEIRYLSQWGGAKKWIDYLPFYVPLPIVGGLLWAFIFQMNRAQRQLMQVANVLYHIDYVEGLLLAINLVCADVNSASEKICNVLDKMISNYMSIADSLSEKSIDAEISKDNINLHTFINLAKEIKEVIK